MFPGAHAATTPDKAAVVVAETGETLTYAQLDDASARLAHVLHDRGLRRGDVVGLLSDNDPRCFVVYWAALRSGLYVTAVNHHLLPAEVGYILDDCGAAAVVVSATKADVARAVVDATPGVRTRIAFGGTVPGHEDLDTVLAAAPAQPPTDQPRGTDMLYSSGTTGRPKGIKPPLPDRQVGDPGDPYTAVFGARYGFGPDTVYLSPAPLYHAAPLRFGGVVQALGGTVVVMQRFDAEGALAAIERFGVTHSQWVPTHFVRLLKLPAEVRERHDHSTLRVAVHAAAPCPPEVKQAMIAWWGPVLEEYYSSSEGNGITFVSSAEWLARPGTVGRGGVLGDVRICGPDGALLPPGEVGTVYFERDERPFSYHGDEARTAAATHPDHPTWTTTGDLGHLDDDGYLFLADRQAFVIISGGVNIYPQEVEDALALHPGVLDVAVIGVPDPEMGESVTAVVQPAPGATPGPGLAAELVAHLRTRVAGYKVPRTVDLVAELPRTPTGKLVKRTLVAAYADRR
ncbi:acyl-CoA synthetase [Rhodococcus aerolatus]